MSARIAGSHLFSIAELLLAVSAVYGVGMAVVVAVVLCGGGSGPKNGFGALAVSCIGAVDEVSSLCEAVCFFFEVDFFEFPGPGMVDCGDNEQRCSVGSKDTSRKTRDGNANTKCRCKMRDDEDNPRFCPKLYALCPMP